MLGGIKKIIIVMIHVAALENLDTEGMLMKLGKLLERI
jgi:hypothetical protein